METKYIALDCNGTPLNFTGSGHSAQCDEKDADVFDSLEQAKAALKLAEETGGSVSTVKNMKPIKATKAGVKAALISMGYNSESDTPPALRQVEAAADFAHHEMAFARYLIHDTDCGGAWNDDSQINLHCV